MNITSDVIIQLHSLKMKLIVFILLTGTAVNAFINILTDLQNNNGNSIPDSNINWETNDLSEDNVQPYGIFSPMIEGTRELGSDSIDLGCE